MGINTLAELIRVHAGERGDQIALIEGDRRQTWAELYERAQRVAGALVEDGVGPGDRVALLDKNGIEHFELMYGSALAGAVCLDVNWRLAPPEVAYIVNDSQAKVLVVGADFTSVLDAIAGQLPAVEKVVVIGDHEGYEPWSSWVDRHEPVDPGHQGAGDDVALQLYSSGTTGRPKGVMITNDNLFALIPAGGAMWGFGPDTVNLVAMPLFHIGGGGWAIADQYFGATSVIVRDLDPSRLMSMFAELGITHAFVVPAVLQFMLMVPGVEDADFSSLRTIVYGASPISEEVLAHSVKVFGCDFWQAYGLTETTGAVVNLPPGDHDVDGPNRHRLRSCGLPGPGTELRIVDISSGEEVPQGEVGEIRIRGPQIMKGYWNMPEATAEAIDADGWFRSGDAGYLDPDGYLYIHDRVKDMIVSGGENVYPAEVENVLMAHPGIADVAVIGVPSERWGETPMAVVVRAPGEAGEALTEEAVIAYSREHLAKFKCPTSVAWIDALPRNPSGKILKKDLRAPYWEGRARQVN
jgi:long-chain acyl-CoA synthetase